jgi:uncharacterized membrane protein
MRIALWLHVTGVVVWVGGMFFAELALRPAAAALPPPSRLPLVVATLSNFFRWAGLAVVVVLVSGAWMAVELGGYRAVGTGVRTMTTIGAIMALVYAYVVLVPYRELRAAVAAAKWEVAGATMFRIRRLVAMNLGFGLATIAIATLARGGA